MPGNVTLSSAVVPEGTCPPWIISLWPNLVALLSANLNGALNVFNYGNATPAPADQGKPWVRLNSDGTFDRLYVYSGGSWVSPHPVATGLIQLWEGDIATVDAFDGGETAAITATTGPMWQRVTELQAKFPIGVGTLPSGTILAVGSTGGEEKHELTIAEMPPHTHDVGVAHSDTDCNGSCTRLIRDAANPLGWTTASTGGSGSPAAVQGHNTLPPYYGVHYLRKTARRMYRL